MRREWKPEDLIECWTMDEAEVELLANKSGATRLGFALLLEFFELERRFPRREDVPRAAVEYVAGQVGVEAAAFAGYRWSGSTTEYHRRQVREFYGFRTATVADEDKLVFWLAEQMCPKEMSRDRLRAALLTRCRAEKIVPPTPTPGQVERLLGAAESMFERDFTARTAGRLGPAAARLGELIAVADPDPDAGGEPGGMRSFLQELKEDRGPIQLETLLAEIVKLERVEALGLGEGLFDGVTEKVVEGWRARAMRMYPSDFAAAPEPVRLTLLVALCWMRRTELTGDDREHVEVSALALHLIAASIAYLNTHLIQIVLREEAWRKRLTDADRRGLSALFWTHLNLYGRFELDMNNHLADLPPAA